MRRSSWACWRGEAVAVGAAMANNGDGSARPRGAGREGGNRGGDRHEEEKERARGVHGGAEEKSRGVVVASVTQASREVAW